MSVKHAVYRLLPLSLREYAGRIEASSLGYRLAHGTLWSFAGAVLSRGLALLASLCVARMLDKERFGHLAMIQSTVGMFGVFAGFGMGITATKHVAEFRRNDPARAGRIIAMSSLVAWVTSGLMTIALLATAPLLADGLKMPSMAGLLRISAGLLLLGGVAGAQTGALCGFEAFKTIAKINLVTGVLTFVLMVTGGYVAGIDGALWALVAVQAATCIMNNFVLRRIATQYGVPLSRHGCMAELPIVWSFSLPAMLVGLMVAPVVWISNKMLFVAAGGEASMGLFQAANQWRTALGFLPGVITPVVLPVLVEAAATRGPDARRRLVKTLGVSLAVVLVPSLLLLACSPLIPALYGDSFKLPSKLVALMVVVACVGNIGMALFTCLQALDKLWLGFVGNLLWAVTLLASFRYLLPSDALGLAWAYALSYALSMLVIAPPIVRRIFGRSSS